MVGAGPRPERAAAAPRRRWLVPREHGAYAQLGCPLVAALLTGKPTGSALSLAVAACALFVAHEPSLVLLGRRGARARREDSGRALGWLGALGAIGLSVGVLGLWLAPADEGVGIAAVAIVALGVLVAVAVGLGAEKTGAGETLVVVALTGCALPVALANGVGPETAAASWGAWVAGLVATTFAVRRVLSRTRGPAAGKRLIVAVCTVASVAGAVWLSPAWAAALPLLVAAGALTWVRVAPGHVRRVGWVLVVASVASTLLTVLISG